MNRKIGQVSESYFILSLRTHDVWLCIFLYLIILCWNLNWSSITREVWRIHPGISWWRFEPAKDGGTYFKASQLDQTFSFVYAKDL